jgi:acetate kinase
VSGRSGDLRVVLEAADAGDEAARLAVAVYLHRLRGSVAAMVAALGSLDALVFTGGVGEHAAPVRAACCGGLGFLGLAVDPEANAAGDGTGADRDVTGPGKGPRVLVLRAREDLEIAREVDAVLAPVGR